MSTYSNWSQGNRAPTPIELGCADKDNPCSLPNAMAADPFLEQIVTQTLEFGVRGSSSSGSITILLFLVRPIKTIFYLLQQAQHLVKVTLLILVRLKE